MFLCWFPWLQFPQVNIKKAQLHLHTQRVALEGRNAELRESASFMMGNKSLTSSAKDIICLTLGTKHACTLLQRKSCLPRLFAIQVPLERDSRTEAVSAPAHKTPTNVRDPWRTVSQQILKSYLCTTQSSHVMLWLVASQFLVSAPSVVDTPTSPDPQL